MEFLGCQLKKRTSTDELLSSLPLLGWVVLSNWRLIVLPAPLLTVVEDDGTSEGVGDEYLNLKRIVGGEEEEEEEEKSGMQPERRRKKAVRFSARLPQQQAVSPAHLQKVAQQLKPGSGYNNEGRSLFNRLSFEFQNISENL